jgi:histidinol dehydrogenase
VAAVSWRNNGEVVVVNSREEAVELSDQWAPEHLEVMTASPMEMLGSIKHAGAIFLGALTPEPIGDYVAGPNHTLPTGGTAKFYSPLSVEHFLKKSSLIMMSEKGMEEIGDACAMIASVEGLGAHEKSVRIRLKK